MKALTEYTDFIYNNVAKFHNLIKNEEVNNEELSNQVGTFVTELFSRAGESIGVSIDILDGLDTKFETIIALFMQANELWYMFCEKYGMIYPDDPPYFYKNVIVETFKFTYGKGFADNEAN